MKRFLTLFLTLFALALFSSTVFGQQGNITFKVPDDVFPIDWKKNNFKGMLMLRKDSPSGIFISYPNDGEKIEELRERAAKVIVPMIAGQSKTKPEEIKFQTSSIPNHKGDSGNAGLYYLFTDGNTTMQILFYEREANGSKFIYGYFAEKTGAFKDIWANDKGQGVKIFEKFWKTFKD